MSLEQLVCALDPVRSIPLPALDPSQANDLGQDNSQPAQQLSIPKELWRLVDALWQGGMREKDLFTSSAEPGEVHSLRLLHLISPRLPRSASVWTRGLTFLHAALTQLLKLSFCLSRPSLNPCFHLSFIRHRLADLLTRMTRLSLSLSLPLSLSLSLSVSLSVSLCLSLSLSLSLPLSLSPSLCLSLPPSLCLSLSLPLSLPLSVSLSPSLS
jgi:hypothetical protein